MLLLGGSLIAVLGAALRSRWLTAGGWSIDFGVSSLLPTLLLVLGGLSLPRRRHRPPPRSVLARLTVGAVPAAIAAVALLPYAVPKPTVVHSFGPPLGSDAVVTLGAPYAWPWLPPSRALLAIFGFALAVAVIVTLWQARTRPERLLATGLVLASVAYPLTFAVTRTDALHVPWWLLNSPYPQLMAVLPALLALALMRRAGRRSAA